MALDDLIPKLDDRGYDELLAEVRTRIARYTPEWKPVWTDVNDSDPGYTLAQVFAWLAEMLTYRMNRVPELNYLKFLQLIGIELRPAEPARANITFPVDEGHRDPYVLVPSGTQVSGDAPEGDETDAGPVIFETERAITALTARLESVQVFDGYSFNDVTTQNRPARPDELPEGFQPFGARPKDGAALYLGFSYGAGSTLTEFPNVAFGLAFFVQAPATRPQPVSCEPAESVIPPARLVWEFWDGAWRSMDLLKDETAAFTRSGQIYMKTPNGLRARRKEVGAETVTRFWLRGRLQRTAYERPPTLIAVRANTALAVQAETIEYETLGGSNGRRDQVFTLAEKPVLAGSLVLQVDDGQGFVAWQEAPDFFGADGRAPVYTLNRTSGEIRFGDGVSGAIPAGNETSPNANILARRYRVGGGKRGNLAAGAIKTLVSSVAGIDPSGVTNLLAAEGGQDEETLAEARRRAPLSLRSRSRAVTAEDFEQFAREAATIKRARALAHFHPDFPTVDVPGAVTVIVVPDSDDPAPMPAEGTLRAVCDYLNARRLLTTELYVAPPEYHLVCVRARVIVADSADLAEVKTAIERSLLDYFHPLKGGETDGGWPFGGRIFGSRVLRRVFATPGVSSVDELTIVYDGEETPQGQDIVVPPNALVYSTRHEIEVLYEFEAVGQP